jgi:SAM-dependent methyltransferase
MLRAIWRSFIEKYFSRGGIFHTTKNYSDYVQRLDQQSTERLILNVGAGGYRYFKRSVNVDPYRVLPGDVQAVGESLPFVDGAFDIVYCCAVLEHVPQPEVIIQEMYRVLKWGGHVYVEIPFLQPVHAAPRDYTRVTLQGLKNWFGMFRILEAGVCVGPGSAVTWILVEYVQLFFGPPFFKKMSRFLTQIALFPLKYLDRWLMGREDAHVLASGFFLFGVKA